MSSVTSRKTCKYKNGFILIPKAVGYRSSAASEGSGCVVSDTTVDEDSGSISGRFVLQFSSVQHSASQRAKYAGPERVPFLWLQAEVLVQLPAVAGKQPRMPRDVPFVSWADNAMHLKINKMINTSQSNDALRTPKTKKQFL